MYYECCVCKKTRQDAILHHFPCTEKRLTKWLKCLNRDDLKKASPEQISKLFVCQKHFEKRFITSKSRLIGKAYPTLFTEDEISSGIASLQNTVTQVGASDVASGGLDVSSHATGYHKVRHMKAPKPSRKRLIRKLKDLTPTSRIVYKEYIKAKRQTDFLRRAKRALKFSKDKSFEKLAQNMNPFAKRIMKMQITLCKKKKKGRRFTNEEKLIALSIMKQSPKCYRFLHKIFVLPSRSTLNKMVAKLKVETGISPQVFALIKKEVATWDEKKKMCSVVFDEMSLEAALTYDKNKDSINGFVELNEKKNEFADHALVFMLRGAVYKWQQPVAFYYCQGATSGMQLKSILKDVISAVVECGLKPIAVICDQGSAFQSAIKSLRDDTKRDQILANQEPDDTITISGANLSIIYDPSHLIKGIRNNFLNKDIIIDGEISKWRDIMDVYETDCNHTEARLLHKLNDQHVIPDKIKKMKVKILPLRGENVTKSLQQRPHTYPHLRANNKNAAGWGTAQTTPGDQRGSGTARPPHL
ncbi:unnamed protein product [Plutella xylostella]|uniref:(diamondback moth) hypothetical protein n=1 Tax=Plutella xylostella TaxID=51655 RepID=A0A8S4G0K1_PLUXY|nr:unnamed protein product [Plutella xylostella]